MKVKFSDIEINHYTSEILYYEEISDLWCSKEEFDYFLIDFHKELREIMTVYSIGQKSALKLINQNITYEDYLNILNDEWNDKNNPDKEENFSISYSDNINQDSLSTESDYFLSEVDS